MNNYLIYISPLIIPLCCPSPLIPLFCLPSLNTWCRNILDAWTELMSLHPQPYLTHLVNIAYSLPFQLIYVFSITLFLSPCLPPSFPLWSRGLVRHGEKEISVCLVHFSASEELQANPGLSCLDASDLFALKVCDTWAQLCQKDPLRSSQTTGFVLTRSVNFFPIQVCALVCIFLG